MNILGNLRIFDETKKKQTLQCHPKYNHFFLAFLLQNKVVVALSVLLLAFFISTISLAVQKNNTKSDLRTCQSDYAQCNDKCDDPKIPAPWAVSFQDKKDDNYENPRFLKQQKS